MCEVSARDQPLTAVREGFSGQVTYKLCDKEDLATPGEDIEGINRNFKGWKETRTPEGRH